MESVYIGHGLLILLNNLRLVFHLAYLSLGLTGMEKGILLHYQMQRKIGQISYRAKESS